MINKVYLIDNMEYMAGVEYKFFDLAIVDPEYGINICEKLTGSSKEKEVKYGYKQHKRKNWDTKPPDEKYFEELFRITKYQIIWGGNYFCDKLPISNGWIVWDKLSTFSSVNPELAWTNFDKSIKIFKRHDGLDKGFLNKEGGHIHPTQKPVALYKWILKNYAQPGWKVFDSHVGSGSSRIACHDMGFDFVGCELDLDYFNAQEDRYQNHISQQGIFSTDEIQELIYQEQII